MSNPKRVWDSKKRAVRQGKEQVWLVDWEKVVNTNHWFAEATWTDVVYDWRWEAPQEPLQTYDKGWEEIPASTGSVQINTNLSANSGIVWNTVRVYVYVKDNHTLTINWAPFLWVNELIHESWDGYNLIIEYTVEQEGTVTLQYTDNITWDLSNPFEFTCYPHYTEVHYNLYNGSTSPEESTFSDLVAVNAYWYQDARGELLCTNFNGNGYMYTDNLLSGEIEGDDTFTMWAWIKLREKPSYDGYTCFMCFWTIGGSANVTLFYHNDQLYIGGWDNDRATGYSFNIWEWYHVVFTQNEGTAIVYINGSVVWSWEVSYNVTNGGYFVIGSNLAMEDQFMNWWINDVFVSESEYTQEEVTFLYNSTVDSHIHETCTVTLMVNNFSRWSIQWASEAVQIASLGTRVSISGTYNNDITIGEDSCSSTWNAWYDFLGWVGAPSKIIEHVTIVAHFFEEWTIPTFNYSLGTISTWMSKSIAIPWCRVKQLTLSWETWDMQIWSGVWTAIADYETNNHFWVSPLLWSNESAYWFSYYGELKHNADIYRIFESANYGLWYTSSEFSYTLTKDRVSCTYGSNENTYTFADYSRECPMWIGQMLDSPNLKFDLYPTNSAFSNATLEVQYERMPVIESASFVESGYTLVETQWEGWSLSYLPINANTNYVEFVSGDTDVVSVTNMGAIDWVLYFSLHWEAEWQTTISAYDNWTLLVNANVTVTPYIPVQSITTGNTNVTVTQGQNVTCQIPITPATVTNCDNEIEYNNSDSNIASFNGWDDGTTWVAIIYGNDIGQSQIEFYTSDDPSTIYTVDVTVTAPAII